jgi:D-glycero-alpha-D-manno-heptose-7-phosphate kinase
MLLARAPLRVSFAGGGTDLDAFSEEYGGFVVSSTIDRYVYVTLTPASGEELQVTSADYRAFARQDGGEAGVLRLPLAVAARFGVDREVRMFVASEVPPGSGVGSSSAVACAAIKAFGAYTGRRMAPGEVASLACDIEIDLLGEPIGRQDQYASAFGGLNAITFRGRNVTVEPIELSTDARRELDAQLVFFYTGRARASHDSVLARQRAATSERDQATIDSLLAMKQLALDLRKRLEAGDVSAVGAILDEGWRLKRGLVRGISSDDIDAWYDLARASGATGGKVLGAGGGGFLVFTCPPVRQQRLVRDLTASGLLHANVRLSDGGARVLVNTLGQGWGAL